MVFGADEGDMIINKTTGARTPIIDAGKEGFVMEILIPREERKTPVSKEDKHEFVQGGYRNALMNPGGEADTSVMCHECCPAIFRRQPVVKP